tara:strand:+ start:1721 stop:2494 length:774 start_codon:yes stop_codon:yes gene_type:complete
MAIINRVSTSNTFQQHVATTDETVTTLNALTEGTGGTFTLSSDVKIAGSLDVTGNLNLSVGEFDNITTNGNVVIQGGGASSNANVGLDVNGLYQFSANTSGAVATRFSVHNKGSSAYIFDQAPGDNPDLDLQAGQTYAFDLQKLNGVHPFVIRTTNASGNVGDTSTYYSVGLTHVNATPSGGLTILKSGAAQAKKDGILYWKVPANTAGDGTTYYYQCTAHASAMVGRIYIGNRSRIIEAKANSITDDALSLAIALS